MSGGHRLLVGSIYNSLTSIEVLNLAGAVVNTSSPCHQEFWVHHMVELLPSELATGQRIPTKTQTKKNKSFRVGLLLLIHYLDELTLFYAHARSLLGVCNIFCSVFTKCPVSKNIGSKLSY